MRISSRIGARRHKLVLQREGGTTPDAWGSIPPSWTAYATTWGSITPLRGEELLIAQQLGAHITHRVEAHYTSGVKERDRVLFGTRTFAITSVLDKDERGIELEILCVEEPSNA